MSEAETQIEPVAPASRASEELYLGDAIHFFLSAKRAGGRPHLSQDRSMGCAGLAQMATWAERA